MITPNVLTWFRMILACICPFILLINRTYMSDIWVMALFAVAGFTDWFDGYLARKQSMVTKMGKVIDPIADKILILGLMIVFSKIGLYHWWWIALIIVREISVTATRFYCLSRGIVLPAEWAGKLKMTVQIASVSLSLFLLTAIDTGQTGFVLQFFSFFHWVGIVLANYFTIQSGVLFFKHLKLKS